MNRLRDFIDEQRELAPSDGAIDRLRSGVMTELQGESRRRFRKSSLLVGGTALAVLTLVIVASLLSNRNALRDSAVIESSLAVESMVITEDHTAIWFEPLNSGEIQNED